MSGDVGVLCWNTAGGAERRAEELAAHVGASVDAVAMAGRDPASMAHRLASCSCLIVHAATLRFMSQRTSGGLDALLAVIASGTHSFVYGFEPGRDDAIVRRLSGGALQGWRPLSPATARFRVTTRHRGWCGQLSGSSLAAGDAGRNGVFVSAGQPDDVLIGVDGGPLLGRVAHGRGDIFFSACPELADLDEHVPAGAGLLPWFSRLAPLMMFLRRSFGTRIWHNPSPRACFIIDDPLLKIRHGFLEYANLLEAMRRGKFSTSIAFIPWNYRRSDRRVVSLFTANAPMPSLCVHGCDHTAGEFAARDAGLLCGKAQLALDRMRAHQRRSGIPFDDVMVFPQGRFSVAALQALTACGYLAAVNTSLSPADSGSDVTLRDAIDVAVTRFGGVPLFGRRYPRDVAEFAFDLFLGKPALAVEHHGYFRNGYVPLLEFVAALNDLDPCLEWTSLATLASDASLRRWHQTGKVDVRFYANRFQLTNADTDAHDYVLSRRHADSGVPPSLLRNGRPWHYAVDEDHVTTTVSLEAGETARLRVLDRRPDLFPRRRPATAAHAGGVLARRLLCEFRDSYVDTSPALQAARAGVRRVSAKRLMTSVPAA